MAMPTKKAAASSRVEVADHLARREMLAALDGCAEDCASTDPNTVTKMKSTPNSRSIG